MKTLLRILLLLTCAAGVLRAATITNLLVDGLGQPVGATVKLKLLSEPYGLTGGGGLVIAKTITVTVGTNGVFNTNINSGLYSVNFGDFYGGFNILVPNDTNTYSMATIATNLASFNVTNYIPTFPASLISDAGTAIYSNATAFFLTANAGTAAYSNTTAFLLSWQTNQPLSQITNAGTAAYSNAADFTLSTYASVSNSLGFKPATNSYAGISNAVGFKLATNSYAGISNAVGFTLATNGTLNTSITFYSTNGAAGVVTNTITITNGMVVGWSQTE